MTMTPEKARALLDRHEQFQHGKASMVLCVSETVDFARAYIAQAAELTRLRAKVEAADKLAEALKFYADLSHDGPWHLPGEDYGKRARAALSAYEEAREPQPTEYETKLAQLKKDFPNGI